MSDKLMEYGVLGVLLLGAAYLLTRTLGPVLGPGIGAIEDWWEQWDEEQRQAAIRRASEETVAQGLAEGFVGTFEPTPEGFRPSNITWTLGEDYYVGLPVGYTPLSWCAEFPDTAFCADVPGAVEAPAYSGPAGCEPLDQCICEWGPKIKDAGGIPGSWPGKLKAKCPDSDEWSRCGYPWQQGSLPSFGYWYNTSLIGQACSRVASMGVSEPVGGFVAPTEWGWLQWLADLLEW